VEVRLRNVVVARGDTTVLHGIDLDLGDGVTVLLGPNGAGKSTLIGALVGLLALDDGALEFDAGDRSARGRAALRAKIGYVPQEIALPAGAALGDVVAYAAWLQRVPRRERHARVVNALEAVRLGDLARKPVNRLSGGMRRRAMLACAIVHRPALLVCDEPTAGLDPEEQHAFRALVAEQGQQRTVLVCTHVLDEAAAIADLLVVLVEGRVRFSGQLDELIATVADGQVDRGDRVRGLERAYLRLVHGDGERVS
jgi:ABC-2 type transport system ATP-binding protein